ncbi:MAG: transposase, partial [Chitinivibrionales bacterium]|nr:transposase [Chitinivibrionales bacterium]
MPMARAHRHFLPNRIWHVTHRCHNRSFLLAASDARSRWLYWLRQAKRRYKLSVLDFNITCNHIHLLLDDLAGRLSIPRGMQLVAGQTAQQYNECNGRSGAFWGGRYHATAVQSGYHLHRCIAYIDLNMVRAGVVNDPIEWSDSGFHHVQTERRRNMVIDYDNLMAHLGVASMPALLRMQKELVREASERYARQRQPIWT